MSEARVPAVPMRRNNVRTALVLATVVLVFFVGVIVRRWLFGS